MYENEGAAPGGLLRRIRFAPAENRRLLFVGTVLGAAILLSLLLGRGYSALVGGVAPLRARYLDDLAFSYLMDMVYSLFCVGIPFFLAELLLRQPGFAPEMRFGVGNRAYNSFMLVFAGLGVAVFGSLVTGWISYFLQSVGIETYSYAEALAGEPAPDGAAGVLLLFARSALVPALVEEYAFRGVVMQTLRRWGDWFAVVVSAVLFALMHGNLTQLPFALVAGLGIGYVAVVSGSLTPGILVHFLNNAISVAVTLVAAHRSEAVRLMFTNLVMYGTIFIGCAAAAFFILRTPAFYRLRPGKAGGTRRKGRWFFLSPAMAAAVLALLWRTLADVKVLAGVLGRGL